MAKTPIAVKLDDETTVPVIDDSAVPDAPDDAQALLNIVYYSLEQLVELFLKGNPTLHDVGGIADSIRAYGFRSPLTIDAALNEGRGGIGSGNGRLKALLEMKKAEEKPPRFIKVDAEGNWFVPCIIGGDSESEDEGLAFAINDNNLTLMGGELTAVDTAKLYDADAYVAILDRLAQNGQMPTSLTDEDYTDILTELGRLDDDEELEDNEENLVDNLDQAALGGIKPRIAEGEIWACGRHRIACGDSTVEAHIKALLGTDFSKVTMVWADAPYGIDIVSSDGSVGGGTQGKYAQVLGDEDTAVATASYNLCTSLWDCNQIFWGANHFGSAVGDASCWLVWDKQGGKTVTFADCELAWTSIPCPVRMFTHIWDGFRRDSERGEERVHPNQKPVALPEWVFDTFGEPDDIIFDPFLGTAPTIIAAQQMEGERTVYGFELSPEYCEVILRRWEDLTGEPPVKIGALSGKKTRRAKAKS